MFQHHLLNTSNREACCSYSSLVVVVFCNHHSHFPFPSAVQELTQPSKSLIEILPIHTQHLSGNAYEWSAMLPSYFLLCGQPGGQKGRAMAGGLTTDGIHQSRHCRGASPSPFFNWSAGAHCDSQEHHRDAVGEMYYPKYLFFKWGFG